MKSLLKYMVVCSLIVALCGCQDSLKKDKPSDTANSPGRNQAGDAVKVAIEENSQFPKFLVGTWRASNNEGWEFVFEADGKITSAVIALGRVRIPPGQLTTVPTITGGKGVFQPGQWTVHYIPSTRELTIKIVIDSLRVEMGDNILEGKSTDVFVGRIAPTGNTWQVEWTSFPQYTGHTKEHPNFDFSGDLVYGTTETLVFEKIVPQ